MPKGIDWLSGNFLLVAPELDVLFLVLAIYPPLFIKNVIIIKLVCKFKKNSNLLLIDKKNKNQNELLPF
jgi:hypothetical protein|tara:strand:- start:786 stop:992 length:207 start_codon:yes stop_codon:yes gene_type:complete